MAFISKKRKVVDTKVDANKNYSLKDASALVKQVTTCKFDASVDLHIRLGVDPKKADQAIRGTVTLPHGTGKTKRVLVLCTPDKEAEAKAAGADHVGLDEFVTKIEGGWVDIDVIIAAPAVMPKIGKLGKVLGPRNLMPNPKTGTVTPDVAKAVEDIKGGKIEFKLDKHANMHFVIGKASFAEDALMDNFKAAFEEIQRLKPSASKGRYIQKAAVSTTFGPGIPLDVSSL